MKIINFVKPYLFKYKGWLFLFLLLSLISKAIGVFFPYLTGSYIDLLIQNRDINVVFNTTFLIIGIGVFNIFSSYIQGYLNVKLQTNAMIDLNFDILKHLVKMPIRYFENKDSGYLNHRINNDSSVVINFLLNSIYLW